MKAAFDEDKITVEQFLQMKLEEMIEDFKSHSGVLKDKLRQEYEDGVKSINLMMKTQTSDRKICVVLKCVAGPHIGQKFRLEPTTQEEEIFKVGRSTGKAFKDKGVSLYKDKEISTTHVKIEIRNGQAFVVDANSTNGTQLNDVDLDPHTPIRLKDGDKLTMGSTELFVNICDENVDIVRDE